MIFFLGKTLSLQHSQHVEDGAGAYMQSSGHFGVQPPPTMLVLGKTAPLWRFITQETMLDTNPCVHCAKKINVAFCPEDEMRAAHDHRIAGLGEQRAKIGSADSVPKALMDTNSKLSS